MATKKYTVRNTTQGFRGLNAVSGYVELNPGEVRQGVEITDDEYRNAEGTNYFAFGADAEQEPEPPAPPPPPPPPPPPAGVQPDELDRLNDADLATTVQAITGKAAPDKKARESDEDYRARLLKLARGQE